MREALLIAVAALWAAGCGDDAAGEAPRDGGGSSRDAGTGQTDGGSASDAGGDPGDGGAMADAGPDGGSPVSDLPVQCRVNADCPVYSAGATSMQMTCNPIPRGRCSVLVEGGTCEGLTCPSTAVCSVAEDIFRTVDFVFCEFLCETADDCGPGLICRDGTCDQRSVCGDCTPYECLMDGDTEACVRPSCEGGEPCPEPLVCNEESTCVEP